ncbi:hypothetical protein D3C84_1250860 [compost metagenome]
MMVARSSGAGRTTSCSGVLVATMDSQDSPLPQADMGRSTNGSSVGTAALTAFLPTASPSRRPTNSSRTPACSST